MPSNQNPVSICNQALGWLGANTITSLDDEDSTEAKLCKANFDPLLGSVLEDHEWSFAIRRNRLVALADIAGDWLPAKAYQIPSDTVRILHVSRDGQFKTNEGLDWSVESNKILVEGLDEIYIRSLFFQRDVAQWSHNATQALAARIAADLAAPITESPDMVEGMANLYQQKLAIAATTDGLQGRSKRIRSSWMREARSGFGTGGGSVG